MSRRFSVGDLVWAKAEGFPFWPGRIASKAVEDELKTFKNHEGKAVLFFGEELTYSLVEEKSIKPFTKGTEFKYTGPADLKEDFKVAVKMALENKDFEEPPLELNEEEGMLNQVKYDIMREASDINTSVEDSVVEDNKQEVEDKNEVVVEGNIEEVEDKIEVVKDNIEVAEDNSKNAAEQKNDENLDSEKNQENAAEKKPEGSNEESSANEISAKTNICDSHTRKVKITSSEVVETEFSDVEKKNEEEKSIDSLSPAVDVKCSESIKDEKETENVGNFKGVDVQEDERKDNLNGSQNIVVAQVSMNPVEANVKDKKKKV